MTISDETYRLAASYSEKKNCDVAIYNGELTSPDTDDFVRECRERPNRRKDVLLILVTPGGSADAAYRLGRCLQDVYEDGTVTVWVTGWCKSAGTLLAIAAHNLIVSDAGELGPLDVQLSKSDEFFEWNSGLVIDSALNSLEARAMSMFEGYFVRIMAKSQGRVTFRTATTIASNMVVNLLAPIYTQIDPIKIGENAREMKVASDYGVRLNRKAQNLRSRQSLSTLVQSYCSHGFVIDRQEASRLFQRACGPDEELRVLGATLGRVGLVPEELTYFGYLSDVSSEAQGEDNEAEGDGRITAGGGEGDAEVIRADFGRAVEANESAAD